MKANEINKNIFILNTLINNAITNSISFVRKKSNLLKNNPEEPDFIASLTINFSKELFNILKAVFPKNKFSVTSIFCHQKPLVDIGHSKSPEIGDILFIYIYKEKTGLKKFNSLLFQAKIASKSIISLSQSDQHQLDLYSNWPLFTYKRAGYLNGKKRDILPKTINDGAQYLLIDNNTIPGSGIPGSFLMGCATPAKTLSINNDLASEIIDFLKFKSGRTFEENPLITKDDWTKMIWDLINITKIIASRRKNIDLKSFNRQSIYESDGLCYFESETKSIFTDLHLNLLNGDIIIHPEDHFNAESSISLVLIECNEQLE